MALHETFTSNPDLAFLLGPSRPDFGLGNTWFGSVSVWAGAILNPFANANPVVEVQVSGIFGVTAIQAEVFGTRSYDETGLASVAVTHIEWSLPGSATVLARYTFASPVTFPLSIGRFAGDWRFVDILNEVLGLGGTAQQLFDDYFNGQDTLIGGGAGDTMYGGNSDDLLDGGAGNDLLRGEAGNDIFAFRTGDATNGDRIDGGSGSDSLRVVGGAVTGVNSGSGVDLSSITIASVEQVLLNGTEAVITLGHLGPGGFETFVGRSGFVDQLTILNASVLNLNALSLLNWDLAADRIAVVGTAADDAVEGSLGQDILVGMGGADTFNGGLGDDRMIILEGDANPQDSFAGGTGNDVLQVDSIAIGSLMVTPNTDLRGMTLSSVEVLDIVKGAFFVDGADFVGSISGTVAAPVTATTGLTTVIGNDSAGTDTEIVLQIEAGGLLGVDLRGVTFQDWNDGFINNNLIRIIAGAQTRVIYGANEYSRIVAAASATGVTIVAGSDVDEVIGSNLADYIQSNGGDDQAFGQAGNDLIDAGTGQDLAYGGTGNDSLGGGEGNDSLYGEANDDFIVGGLGNDQLEGGDGTDILNGGAGSDQLNGGAGAFDFASYSGSTIGLRADLSAAATNSGDAGGDSYIGIENLQGGNFNDTLLGDGQSNYLYGQNGDDALSGGAGNDLLYGHQGNDTLVGGTGADRLDGDVGDDVASYTTATAAVRIDLVTQALNGGDAAGDTLFFIEHLEGSDFADTMAGDGAGNRIWGYGSDDALDGRDGNDTLLGGAGNDSLQGGAGDDTLAGGGGDDTLAGGTGNDTLLGSAGDDIYYVNTLGDQVFETTTTTSIVDAGGIDTLQSTVSFNIGGAIGVSFVERLTLLGTDNINGTGNVMANRLTGNSGNNLLNGGLGDDTMIGGAGNDIYVVGTAGDRVFETTTTAGIVDAGGIDTVQSAVTFNLGASAGVGFVERLTLTGSGNTNGTGNALANRLTGNLGNNVLNGGLGKDTLIGGAGNDSFVFNTAPSAANLDLVDDFNVAQDTIRLDDLVFAGMTAGALAASAFVANLTGVATDALDRILYETDTGRLYFDADGTGAGARVHFATVTANLALTNADFVVF